MLVNELQGLRYSGTDKAVSNVTINKSLQIAPKRAYGTYNLISCVLKFKTGRIHRWKTTGRRNKKCESFGSIVTSN